MSDQQSGVSVSVGLSLAGRALKVTDVSGERDEVELIGEWGTTLRTNIYRTPTGELGILDFDGAWKVLRDPLRLEGVSPSDDWQYLGTLIDDTYRDATGEAECMDILMDEPPPPHRSWVYRRRCE